MSILPRKNKSDIPTNDELSVLDTSVASLNLQTKELLGKFKEENTPPTTSPSTDTATIASHSHTEAPSLTSVVTAEKMPRHVSPSIYTPSGGGGKSFDIIRPPMKRRLQSSLRTRPKEEDSAAFLPTQTEFRDNEAEESQPSVQKIEQEKDTDDTPRILHSHASGALRHKAVLDDEDDTQEETPPLSSSDLSKPNAFKSKDTTMEPAEGTATEPFAFQDQQDEDAAQNETTEDGGHIAVASDESPHEQLLTIKNTTEATTTVSNALLKTEETEEEVSFPQEELSAEDTKDDSHKDSPSTELQESATTSRSFEPKGYQPVEGHDLPFDTSEYHPDLHDWSTLGQRKRIGWYILAVIVVLAGAAAYFLLFQSRLSL